MTAYRGGDDRAFVDLIGRYDSRLRGMCWHYLRDQDMVDDVLQETFCRVIEGAHRIDQGFNVAAWIHRIAANLCIDELRRRTQRTRSHVVYADADSVVNDIADTDQRGRPEKALELDATASLIRAAIQRLPERQRHVLILRDVRGLSEAATASVLGLSCSAVQGVLHRARERFKDGYLTMESDQSPPGECGQVAFIFEHIRLTSLRKDRLKAVNRHLRQCRWCQRRFGPGVLDAAYRPNGEDPEGALPSVSENPAA
jgi:RNA polymerase sigma-70 factor (ECF subfamily)